MTVCTLREKSEHALTTKSGLITPTYCLHVIPRLARVYYDIVQFIKFHYAAHFCIAMNNECFDANFYVEMLQI